MVIRSYKTAVHQGINRLVWDMRRDGIKPLNNDDDKKKADDDLPAGPQVLPGKYELNLQLDDVEVSQKVEVLQDPRNTYSVADLQVNFDAQLALMNLRDTSNTALRQIIDARNDVATIRALVSKRITVEETAELKALKARTTKVKKGLDELEKMYRVPEKTKGITYRGDTVSSKLGNASFYVGSADGAPSPAAHIYLDIARTALSEATEKLNGFMRGELDELREKVAAAGITLLPVNDTVLIPE